MGHQSRRGRPGARARAGAVRGGPAVGRGPAADQVHLAGRQPDAAVLELAVFIPSLAVSWRRLHDVDRTGAWIFITFIPILGLIVYVIMTATGSRPGGARFD